MSHSSIESTPSMEIKEDAPPRYDTHETTVTVKTLDQPIVIPQTTNLFYIKTFSPFARCYSPALADLPNSIPEDEFLALVDRLNHVFLSLPIFQAAHITGGALLSSQVLPAQVVGGVLQVTSVVASASVSFLRVRKFMKAANDEIFAPRGLLMKVQTTKKMMASIGFTETDAKGKLKLPPLETLQDLGPYSPASSVNGSEIQSTVISGIEDPRLLRLQVLKGYIAPLTFDVQGPAPESMFSRYSQAPLRWANKRQSSSLEKAHVKYNKKRDSKASAVEAEMLKAELEIKEIERQIEVLQYDDMSLVGGTGREKDEIEALEIRKAEETEKRNAKVKEIYNGTNKKINKVYKKEEKVANRILWIVIQKMDGSVGDGESLFHDREEV